MAFELKNLEYPYDALEPAIDAQTMEIHHQKHHRGYTAKLNAAIAGTDLEGRSIEELLKNVAGLPEAVRNNGGGYFNHNLFWSVMSPDGGGNPEGDLLNAINRDFGSPDAFRKKFSEAAAGRFGSGWAWLIKQNNELVISSTPNQDNPLMDLAGVKGVPVLGLDVWEHAYYLKYQNRRTDYIEAFWDVINWKEVENRYLSG